MSSEQKGHPAKELLRELAEVAEWHPEPWREFQFWGEGVWRDFASMDGFGYHMQNRLSMIRRRPRTKRIGEYDVPLPVREVPKKGTTYWIADAGETNFRWSSAWHGDPWAHEWLSRGLIHLDPESAAIHGQALASLMSAEDVELMQEDEG